MPKQLRPPSITPSRGHKSADFNDRLDAAAAAKRAILERFQARPGPDDPAVRAQHAARQATSDARDVRTAERHAGRAVEAARQAAEHAEKAAERAAREAEERNSAAHIAARAIVLEAERKAKRDARYAARKSRR
jgi:Family of unknown function (DUF6481)